MRRNALAKSNSTLLFDFERSFSVCAHSCKERAPHDVLDVSQMDWLKIVFAIALSLALLALLLLLAVYRNPDNLMFITVVLGIVSGTMQRSFKRDRRNEVSAAVSFAASLTLLRARCGRRFNTLDPALSYGRASFTSQSA
jgi:hypothetical protein